MIRDTLTAVASEFQKGLLLSWYYKLNFFLDMLMMVLAFLGLALLIGGGTVDPERVVFYLPGYLVWYYATRVISDMSWNVRDEMQTGTLEQMYMSPTPSGLLILGRTLATLSVTTLLIIVMGGGLLLIFGLTLPLPVAVLPVLLLTLFGLLGFGLMVGGATLIFKHTESLGDLLQYLLIFMNGAWISVDAFPEWLAFIARLLPTTWGIELLRRLIVEGSSPAVLWANQSLIWLSVHSLTYFLLGWFFFRWCEQIARVRGSLGQY